MTEVIITTHEEVVLSFRIEEYDDHKEYRTTFTVYIQDAFLKTITCPLHLTRETMKRIVRKIINEYKYDMKSVTIGGVIY